MKNKEKYADDIIKVAIGGNVIAMQNGKIRECEGLYCNNCDFSMEKNVKHWNCEDFTKFWAEQEYKEQSPKLTKRERAFIDFIVSDFTLVRASDGTLYLNCFSTLAELDSDMFTFVNEVVDKKTLLSYEVES